MVFRLNRTVELGSAGAASGVTRTWPGLLATGTVGGIDISTGILGLLIVHSATNNALLGALAFPIGFLFFAIPAPDWNPKRKAR